MKNLIKVMVAVATFGGMALSIRAATILPPGSIWEYTFADPTADPTWNTTVGGWQTGPAPFGNSTAGDGYDDAFDPGTYWPENAEVWLRTKIDLTGYDLSTVAYGLGVDNGFELFINGASVAKDNAEGFTYRWEYSGALTGLVAGENIVALALEDHGVMTAFDMQITGERTQAGVPDTASTLGLFGLAAAGLGLFRSRRS